MPPIRFGLVSAAVVILAASAASAQAPMRKPGWWDITVTTMGVATKVQVCTDPQLEKLYPSVAGNPGDDCTQAVVTPSPKGYAFSISCKTPGGPAKTSGTASGDFNTRYRVDAVTRMANPPIPALAQIPTAIDGRYAGACPPPRRPGDLVMGGKVTNLLPH